MSAGDAFWDYAVARYARDGAGPRLVAMQDEWGANVCFVLLCLWCGVTGLRLTAADVSALSEGATEGWHKRVVEPLRLARRALRDAPDAIGEEAAEALRDKVKALELEAERLEMHMLADLVEARLGTGIAANGDGTAAERQDIARGNLAAYLDQLGVAPGPAREDTLATLVRLFCDA